MEGVEKARSIVKWMCVASLSSILLVAAARHLLSFDHFLVTINKYHIFSGTRATVAIGVLLIILMFASGTGLWFREFARDAAIIASVVFGGFAIAVTSATIRGFDFTCGCALGDRPFDWIAAAKPFALGLASICLIGWDSENDDK